MERKLPIVLLILIGIIVVFCISLFLAVIVFKSKSYRNGAVIASQKECANIGGRILKMNGSFADAAIAMLFCESVHQPQIFGIGGGFLALIYLKADNSSEALIAREVAPLAAKEDMFINRTCEGGLAIAVPGEVKGYYALHRRYGRLKWADLLRPAIHICETGLSVTKELADDLKAEESEINSIPSLKEIFVNPATKRVYEKGDVVRYKQLARTLKVIASEGEASIYKGGKIGKRLVEDIRALGGIITEEDLTSYRYIWKKGITVFYNNYTIHAVPLPGSGVLLKLMLRSNRKMIPLNDKNQIKHTFTSFLRSQKRKKHQEKKNPMLFRREGSGQIYRRFQDPKTLNVFEHYLQKASHSHESGSLANVAVVSPTGDAITVTSTLHARFGAMRRSPQTGIILNNQMKNFLPTFHENPYAKLTMETNYIKPGKFPLTFSCPTIIIDSNGFPRLLIGSSGGPASTFSVAKIIFNHLGPRGMRKKSKFNTFKMADWG